MVIMRRVVKLKTSYYINVNISVFLNIVLCVVCCNVERRFLGFSCDELFSTV